MKIYEVNDQIEGIKNDKVEEYNVNWIKVNVAPSNHKLQYLDLCRTLYPDLDNLRKYRY